MPAEMAQHGSGIRRAEIVGLLSCATSMALGLEPEFGLKSTVLAMALARRLALSQAELETTYWYALLRFAGCNAENHAFSALVGDEVAFNREYMQIEATPAQVLPLLVRSIRQANARRDPLATAAAVAVGLATSQKRATAVLGGHCDVAQQLARRLEFGEDIIEALGQSRERWDGKGLFGIKGRDQPSAVRLVPICNDAAVLVPLLGRAGALELMAQRSGTTYDPAIARVFLMNAEELLDGLERVDPWDGMLAAEPGMPSQLAADEAEDALLVIADFCDLKLPDAISHSRSVTTLAVEAARQLGLPEGDLAALHRAGLLHDIGYAGVPVKARTGVGGPASEVKLHPFHGEELLARVPALSDAAQLVGRHHEALNGSGYFRGLGASSLSTAARVLAAAEAYQSFAEGRFGRGPLGAAEGRAAVNAGVQGGRLDADAAKAVLAAAGHKVPIKKKELVAGLTNRELDILKLVATGLTTKQVGARLGISPKTVDNHLQNLYPKIEVKTRAGATLFAIENGLCALPK